MVPRGTREDFYESKLVLGLPCVSHCAPQVFVVSRAQKENEGCCSYRRANALPSHKCPPPVSEHEKRATRHCGRERGDRENSSHSHYDPQLL